MPRPGIARTAMLGRLIARDTGADGRRRRRPVVPGGMGDAGSSGGEHGPSAGHGLGVLRCARSPGSTAETGGWRPGTSARPMAGQPGRQRAAAAGKSVSGAASTGADEVARLERWDAPCGMPNPRAAATGRLAGESGPRDAPRTGPPSASASGARRTAHIAPGSAATGAGRGWGSGRGLRPGPRGDAGRAVTPRSVECPPAQMTPRRASREARGGGRRTGAHVAGGSEGVENK